MFSARTRRNKKDWANGLDENKEKVITMDGKELQFNIDFGNDAFFAENVVVSHSQSKFIIDFTQAIPRFDQLPGLKDPKVTMVVKHKATMMDPHGAKEFLNVLSENIKKYEAKFGEIKVPKKEVKEVVEEKQYQPTSSSYIG